MTQPGGRTFWQAFGPGVLFAGAAVGVSHLVQSTRAGAEFGFALLLVVIGANLVKYPAFRFGPHYAAATGTSLLEGYRRQGRWALALYALLTVCTMFTVQAAVTIVTAALAKALFGLELHVVVISAILIAICAGLIVYGRYQWLDRVVKVVVAVLTLSTFAATMLALGQVRWAEVAFLPRGDQLDPVAIGFIAALVGWMPSAIDVSVWQSLWTLARSKDTRHKPSLRESMLDFHIGYLGTAFLAVCFLILGAAVMHGRGIPIESSAGGFANQIIALYTSTLGDWSRPVIGAAALSVMFSTTLTVVDGFPRALSVLAARFRGPEDPTRDDDEDRFTRRVYWGAVAVLAIGALAVLQWFLADLTSLVDVATILSFLTAPLLSWLNHRAVLSVEVPGALRPGRWLIAGSIAGIALQGAFALYYLTLRF